MQQGQRLNNVDATPNLHMRREGLELSTRVASTSSEFCSVDRLGHMVDYLRGEAICQHIVTALAALRDYHFLRADQVRAVV